MALRIVHLGSLMSQKLEGLRHAMHMVLHTMQSSVLASAIGCLCSCCRHHKVVTLEGPWYPMTSKPCIR